MLRIICILLYFSTLSLSAQTHTISHKSHSGGSGPMEITEVDKLGCCPQMLVKIVRIENIADTATIFYYGWGNSISQEIRIENHPIFNNLWMDLDSVQETYSEEVIWEGFPSKAKKKKNQKEQSTFLIPVLPDVPPALFLLITVTALITVGSTYRNYLALA